MDGPEVSRDEPEAAVAAAPEDDDEGRQSQPSPQKRRRRAILIALAAVAVGAALIAAVLWWRTSLNYESTDDAFIDGRPVSMSALVPGEIVDVPVTDNQLVQAGAVLARIDDRDYAAASAQAAGRVVQAQAGVASVEAQLATQQTAIDQTARLTTEAQAALTYAQQQNQRAQDLVKQGAGTVQASQQSDSDLRQKEAALGAAKLSELQARKQLDVLRQQQAGDQAQVKQAQAQSEQAAANLARVTLRAPVEGRVTALTAAKGAYAALGQTLMIIVPTQLWVTANFKETQLAAIRPGQPVNIEIDAYGRTFPGRVDSVQAGSGTAFSLLPAENATGNYVKVVQRVPVKIVFDKPPDIVIGPGMSVVPTVRVK